MPQENKLRSKKHRTSGGWRAKGNDKTAKLVIQGGCQRGNLTLQLEAEVGKKTTIAVTDTSRDQIRYSTF